MDGYLLNSTFMRHYTILRERTLNSNKNEYVAVIEFLFLRHDNAANSLVLTEYTRLDFHGRDERTWTLAYLPTGTCARVHTFESIG